MMFDARPVAAALLGLVAAWSLTANAQQVFRIVGPDGRVTFSDRPPAEGQAAKAAPVVSLSGSNPAATDTNLPFELRTAATRYPVTLYSRPGCVPCDSGRSFLAGRGIPFAERSVTSQEDVEALTRLAGTPTLPFATIGAQQLKGFSEVEWAQFLDAAGYPRSSQLPPGYRQQAARPLVVATQPPAATASDTPDRPARAQRTAPAAPPAEAAENPTGIRF
jgi:glutaredoxin